MLGRLFIARGNVMTPKQRRLGDDKYSCNVDSKKRL